MSGDSQIIDLALVDEKALPAWEFRSNFVKSKVHSINGRKLLDLYYSTRIESGSYLCRLERHCGTRNLTYFILTERGKIQLAEIPSNVEQEFDQFSV